MKTITVSTAQLAGMTVSPLLEAVEATFLQIRIRHSSMAVQVLEKKLRNDAVAMTLARTMPNSARLIATLARQIAETAADIEEEQRHHVSLSARLSKLQMRAAFRRIKLHHPTN